MSQTINTPAVTLEVTSRFQGLRKNYFLVCSVTCAATTLAIALLCWSILAIGDYIWEWPLLIRRVFAAVSFAGLGIYLVFQLSRLFSDATSGRFASRLEQRFESLGQRLRTVLEAADGRLRAPDAMLSALGHQTLGRWETASPATILPLKTATAALAGCLALLVLGLVAIAFSPDWHIASMRALGSERAYTELEVAPGNTRLLEGTILKLQLQLHGRTDRNVTLRYRQSEEDSWIESDLIPTEDKSDERHASFEASIGKLTHPIEYQFMTSVGDTELYRVDVQPFIQIDKFETLVTPPTYTHLDQRSFTATELTVLAGSRVQFAIETNHPLAEAQLLVGDKLSTLQASDTLQHESPKLWAFELPSSASVHWQFSGKGADGTPIAPMKGRLRIRYDEEPRIEWRDPPEEIKVHMLAELPMKAQLSDDYGLSESGIVFQVGDEDEYVLKTWSQSEVEGATSDSVITQLRLEELLPLESLLLSERDFVTYHAYAIDNREGSPQRVETDTRYIDIQPLRQFWAEQEDDPNAGAGGGGVVPQLEEIIRRQRFLINRTRRESRNQQPADGSAEMLEQLPKIERMVASQSELADLTRFLMEFLASQGNDDTEALSQAEAAMLQAVDSLTKADFVSALAQEEEAGRALVEARNSIEITLRKNRTPQQAAQMRAFVRQMQQKLRRTPAKTDKQLADSLEQIANEQKRIGIELEQTVASGTKLTEGGNTAGSSSPSTDQAAPKESSGSVQGEESVETTQKDSETQAEEIKLETREQDLVERVRAIDTGLSQAVKRSSLVGERMEASIKAMDELTGKLRDAANAASTSDSSEPVSKEPVSMDAEAAMAYEISDQLRELAMHLSALSQSEPANRVSSLRDMTATLSNMEREVSRSMAKSSDLQEVTQDDAAQLETAGKLAQVRKTAERIGKRLDERATTIEDVLKTTPDLGSLEANEINDRIQKLVDELEFLEDLASSRNAMKQPVENKETGDWVQAADSRSAEYADAAMQLDSLYRQLVMPRTDQLRKLESIANQLSKAISQQGGGGGKPTEPQPQGKGGAVEFLKRELQAGLKEAELEDLLEMLTSAEQEKKPESSASEVDPAFQDSSKGTVSDDQFSLNKNPLFNGVIQVQKELRSRIQELIMLEIAADRDSPVPSQYRELIDGYFRTIAGGDDATQEKLQ